MTEAKREAQRKFRQARPNYNRDWLRKWREINPDYSSKTSRKYRRKNPKKNYEKSRKWIVLNPIAARAYRTVFIAVKSGKLIRKSCQVCGNPRTQGHHSDYTQPLKVDWLCALHHKERHINP